MKVKVKERVNWPITILLILGLVTVIFPLYLTVVIAFKKPSEMTNSISGILSLPKSWSFSNFAEAMRVTDFWHSLGNSADNDCNGSSFHSDSFYDRLCDWKK